MTERWTEGGFFKNRPSQTHWVWFEPLLGLGSRVKRAALPQSQHYPSEQSISEEKQRNREKKGTESEGGER